MNLERLVAALRDDAATAADDCVSTYAEGPPGRSPDPGLVELSKWFQGLSEEDRKMVHRACADAAHGAVFGTLCILDGVRAIETDDDEYRFEIWYATENGRSNLTEDDCQLLHDEFNAV